MRVAIDNRAVIHSGIGNYSAILLSLLPKVNKDIETIAYEDNLTVNRQGLWNKYINGFRRVIKDQITIFGWVRRQNIEIFHNPRNTGVPIFCPCKVVVTIHDVIPHVFPKFYLSNYIEHLYYEVMIRLSIYRSDKIITISEFSKQELIKYYQVPADKIVVIPLACSDKFRVLDHESIEKVKTKYQLKRPYILTIGGSEYRKNVKTVLEAYDKELNKQYDLIVIGGSWRGRDLANEYKDKDGIKFLTGIPDDDLVALYNGATVFVYASIYEGFGLPLLEAMQSGTPVIAADSSCLYEVAGDAAVYFRPVDVIELKKRIKAVLIDCRHCNDMISAGFARAQLYSWEKTIARTYEVYKNLL